MGLFGKSNTTTNKSKQKKRPMFGTNKKPTFGIELESPTVNSGDVLNGKVWADIPSELKGTRMQKKQKSDTKKVNRIEIPMVINKHDM